MGRSDSILQNNFYGNLPNKEPKALLGFSNNNWLSGDLYDLELGNWDINSEWKLTKKYNSIISTRCPYFSAHPKDFIKRCHDNLEDGGEIFLDWGLGDHWRFDNYKVGWIKDGEQEYAYVNDNFLWSCVWDDSFLENEQYKLFEKKIEKFGYTNLKESIFEEVPVILELDYIKKYFKIEYDILQLWDDLPQLYISIRGNKI